MQKSTKTDNFLKAIHKYAEQQRNAMRTEAEQLKDEKLKAADAKGRRDSVKLIKDKITQKRNLETSQLAKKQQDSQKRLFVMRNEMTQKVFEMAEKKLAEYTASADYQTKLAKSADEIAELFGSNDCILYINKRDIDAVEALKSRFTGNVTVEADKSVRIGGIKGYCKAMSIVADETLDSKLDAQREWFIENSGLTVL